MGTEMETDNEVLVNRDGDGDWVVTIRVDTVATVGGETGGTVVSLVLDDRQIEKLHDTIHTQWLEQDMDGYFDDPVEQARHAADEAEQAAQEARYDQEGPF